jgi:hypothetical protein
VAVGVAGWQCGSDEPKMSEIGAVLAELHADFVWQWQWLGGSGSGSGGVAVRFE